MADPPGDCDFISMLKFNNGTEYNLITNTSDENLSCSKIKCSI